MCTEIPDADYVYNALLSYNYFPMGKQHHDEIPPVFSTIKLTPAIADKLIEVGKQRPIGYDQIDYYITRHNNATRLLQIPHPLPYARLCQAISKNWQDLSHICTNDKSQIKPRKHDDKRIIILGDYGDIDRRVAVIDGEKFPNTTFLKLGLSTGKNYRVTADISSCYPSIYTHSIPWAIAGIKKAKKNHSSELFYNKLDQLQRALKRNETQGIPIGPGTSAIISELILSKIDGQLEQKDFNFIRFIDDYKCYCVTKEEAEDFLLHLERFLHKYLLKLNTKKTLIEELPVSVNSSWVTDLANHLTTEEEPSEREVSNFLDYSIQLQKCHPKGSVLKYAFRSIMKLVNNNNINVILSYLNSLVFHYPVLLPLLCEVSRNYREYAIGHDIESTIDKFIKLRRSDAICWCLFYMDICDTKISEKLAASIINTQDSISITMLLALEQHEDKVIEFIKSIDKTAEYELDKHWLLVHEIGHEIQELTDYRKRSGLEFLYEENIHFINQTEEQKLKRYYARFDMKHLAATIEQYHNISRDDISFT